MNRKSWSVPGIRRKEEMVEFMGYLKRGWRIMAFYNSEARFTSSEL